MDDYCLLFFISFNFLYNIMYLNVYFQLAQTNFLSGFFDKKNTFSRARGHFCCKKSSSQSSCCPSTLPCNSLWREKSSQNCKIIYSILHWWEGQILVVVQFARSFAFLARNWWSTWNMYTKIQMLQEYQVNILQGGYDMLRYMYTK